MIDLAAFSSIDDTAVLIALIGRAVDRRFGDLLTPTGLRPRHIRAMLALREKTLAQQDLGTSLAVHPTKLVLLLNDLETAGLIVRRRDAADRRRHTVALSELGRARLAAVDIAREKLDAIVFEGIPAVRRSVLRSLLERVGENIGLESLVG